MDAAIVSWDWTFTNRPPRRARPGRGEQVTVPRNRDAGELAKCAQGDLDDNLNSGIWNISRRKETSNREKEVSFWREILGNWNSRSPFRAKDWEMGIWNISARRDQF
jgi:hypothetical protein